MREPQRKPVPKAQARGSADLSELITPEYIPAEVFLENMGFFTPSSKRIKGIYVKEKKVGEKIDSDGARHTLKIEISANHKLGLPVTSDLDYYRAFLKICDEVVDHTAGVIGKPGKDISVADAWNHVAGLVVANDVSARDVQLKGFTNGIITGLTADGWTLAQELRDSQLLPADVLTDILSNNLAISDLRASVLTGGYMTLAATLCSARVADALGGPLMHGPTYMANPLATATALASTDLLADGAWREDVARIERGLRIGLEPARELPGVADVRVLGAIGVIELERPVDVAAVTRAAVARGVWLRPFRELIYAMPPYVTEDEDVTRIAGAMLAGAAQTTDLELHT